jgi:excisionase family DNA binding protein
MDSQAKGVMTVPELCDYLQLSEAKVREMLRQGTLPAVLIGRQWRIRRSAIDRWMEAQEQAAKVITRRGGQERVIARGDRLARAVMYESEDLPSPKPPRQSRTVEEVDPGARKPPLAPTPAEVSPEVRRQMAEEAVKREREERRAKGRR